MAEHKARAAGEKCGVRAAQKDPRAEHITADQLSRELRNETRRAFDVQGVMNRTGTEDLLKVREWSGVDRNRAERHPEPLLGGWLRDRRGGREAMSGFLGAIRAGTGEVASGKASQGIRLTGTCPFRRGGGAAVRMTDHDMITTRGAHRGASEEDTGDQAQHHSHHLHHPAFCDVWHRAKQPDNRTLLSVTNSTTRSKQKVAFALLQLRRRVRRGRGSCRTAFADFSPPAVVFGPVLSISRYRERPAKTAGMLSAPRTQ